MFSRFSSTGCPVHLEFPYRRIQDGAFSMVVSGRWDSPQKPWPWGTNALHPGQGDLWCLLPIPIPTPPQKKKKNIKKPRVGTSKPPVSGHLALQAALVGTPIGSALSMSYIPNLTSATAATVWAAITTALASFDQPLIPSARRHRYRPTAGPWRHRHL